MYNEVGDKGVLQIGRYLPIDEIFHRLHKTIVRLLYVYIGNVINVVFWYEMEITIFSRRSIAGLVT